MLRRVAALGLLVVAALGTPADAAGWTITDLGTLGRSSGATHVAVAGDGTVYVAGWWGPDTGPERPFRWDSASGRMLDLPPYPGDTSATAVGVDPLGRVAGRSQQCGTSTCVFHAVLWTVTAGVVATHLLSQGEPADLSADGRTLAGFAGTGSARAGATWTIPAVAPYATDPRPMAGDVQRVSAVNDSGVVLSSTAGSLPVSAVRLHPTVDGPYAVELLGRLPGHDTVLPYALSNAGAAVGATYNSMTGPMQPVLWPAASTAAVALAVPAASKRLTPSGYARDVDEAGVVVGQVSGRAVMWPTPTQLIDLNTLLPARSGWVLERAGAISRTGRLVVGQGQRQVRDRAFLLTSP